MRPHRAAQWLLVLGLCLPRPATAQITERLYQEACDDGDVSACVVFGLMSELGQGVSQDFVRARELYRRACEGGEFIGCTNLGLMYEEGVGGEQDLAEARGRYQIACEGYEQLACDLLAGLDQLDPGDGSTRVYLKEGRVADAETTTALSNALVEVPDLDIRQVSDAQGRVSLGRLPAGTYLLRVQRLGYAVLLGELEVPGGSQFLVLMERGGPEDPNAPGRIEGRVTDAGIGEVANAEISVVGQDLVRTLSGERGYFTLVDVEPGLIQLRFTRLGYAPRTATLVLQPGRTSEVTVAMSPEVIALAPIEVTVRSPFLERGGYYARARQGLGRRLSREDLDRIDPFDVSQALETVPGLRLQRSTNLGTPVLAVSSRVNTLGNGQCVMDVYIDGVRMSSPDLNQIPPDWLDAMEVYIGSEAPAQYAGLNPCGVVLLWTRR